MLFRLLTQVIAVYDMKIRDIKDKIPNHFAYTTTKDFNKFSDNLFDERLKQPKLAANKYLGTTVEQCAFENKERIEKSKSFAWSSFNW